MAKIDRLARAQALFATDEPFHAQGLVVAGMDEVGRGPLAGNVVTACHGGRGVCGACGAGVCCA